MRSKFLPLFVFSALIAGIQLITQITDSAYHLTQLTMTAYYSLLIVGLCMLIGYAGQISLGHAGFFAIGGYLTAFLTTRNLAPHQGKAVVSLLSKSGMLVSRPDIYGGDLLTIHTLLSCVAAVLLAVVIAYL